MELSTEVGEGGGVCGGKYGCVRVEVSEEVSAGGVEV